MPARREWIHEKSPLNPSQYADIAVTGNQSDPGAAGNPLAEGAFPAHENGDSQRQCGDSGAEVDQDLRGQSVVHSGLCGGAIEAVSAPGVGLATTVRRNVGFGKRTAAAVDEQTAKRRLTLGPEGGAMVFVTPEEEPVEMQAGGEGAEVLVLQFSR